MNRPPARAVLWQGAAWGAAALVLLGAGTGGAVAGSLVTGTSIKDNTVTSADIKKNSLTITTLSKQTQAALLGTDATVGTAGTPALADVVDWTFATTEPAVPPEDRWSWAALAGPSTGTIPSNSRVTFVGAEVTGDFSTCPTVVMVAFYAVDPETQQRIGLGAWGQLGSEATVEWDADWGFGRAASDVGQMAILSGPEAYPLEATARCIERRTDPEYPEYENPFNVPVPPLEARVVLLVETIPTKAERHL